MSRVTALALIACAVPAVLIGSHAGRLKAQTRTAPPANRMPSVSPDQGEFAHWAVEDLKKCDATLSAARSETGLSQCGSVPTLFTHSHAYSVLHRQGQQAAEVHDGYTEVYFVIAGGASAIVGGELVGKTPVKGGVGEFHGTQVNGGETYKLKTGDILSIPPSAPSFLTPDANGITYMSIKINVAMYPFAYVAMATANAKEVPVDIGEGKVLYWSAESLQKAHAILSAASEAAGGRATNQGDLVKDMPISGNAGSPITRTHAWGLFLRPHETPPRFVENHEGASDIYMMTGGASDIVIGGELDGAYNVDNLPGELRAKGIKEGTGMKVHVKAGDVMNIPPLTNHWTLPEVGGLSYMLIKVNVDMYPWTLRVVDIPK